MPEKLLGEPINQEGKPTLTPNEPLAGWPADESECWCDVIEDDVPHWDATYFEHDDVPHWDRYKDRHRCGRRHIR